jgi:hypothetical protein
MKLGNIDATSWLFIHCLYYSGAIPSLHCTNFEEYARFSALSKIHSSLKHRYECNISAPLDRLRARCHSCHFHEQFHDDFIWCLTDRALHCKFSALYTHENGSTTFDLHHQSKIISHLQFILIFPVKSFPIADTLFQYRYLIRLLTPDDNIIGQNVLMNRIFSWKEPLIYLLIGVTAIV